MAIRITADWNEAVKIKKIKAEKQRSHITTTMDSTFRILSLQNLYKLQLFQSSAAVRFGLNKMYSDTQMCSDFFLYFLFKYELTL